MGNQAIETRSRKRRYEECFKGEMLLRRASLHLVQAYDADGQWQRAQANLDAAMLLIEASGAVAAERAELMASDPSRETMR